jgi:hypothetical protein
VRAHTVCASTTFDFYNFLFGLIRHPGRFLLDFEFLILGDGVKDPRRIWLGSEIMASLIPNLLHHFYMVSVAAVRRRDEK